MPEAQPAQSKRTKPNGTARRSSRPKQQQEPANKLLLAGAGVLGAAAIAAAVIITREVQRKSPPARRESSLFGALARTALLSATHALTAYVLEKAVLPQLPLPTASPSSE